MESSTGMYQRLALVSVDFFLSVGTHLRAILTFMPSKSRRLTPVLVFDWRQEQSGNRMLLARLIIHSPNIRYSLTQIRQYERVEDKSGIL